MVHGRNGFYVKKYMEINWEKFGTPFYYIFYRVFPVLSANVSNYLAHGQKEQDKPCKNLIKLFTKLFSVDSYVFFPVESNSAMYHLISRIVNEIISIFDTWAEITGKTL